MTTGKKIAKALGLIPRVSFHGDVYDEEDVHRVLNNAVRVSGNGETFFKEPYDGVATHQAWVIGIETKKNKTVDQFLDEVIGLENTTPELIPPHVWDLIDEIKEFKRRIK